MKSKLKMYAGLLSFLLVIVANIGAQQKTYQGLAVEKDQEPKPLMILLKPEIKSPITDQDAVVAEIGKLFEFDLMFSGAFEVVPETAQASYLNRDDNTRGNVDFKAWQQLQVNGKLVDYVVKSILVSRGQGLYELDIMVYDIQQGLRTMGTAYGADPHPPFNRKLIRTAGHQATADIIKTLSNNQVIPITQTRFAFVNNNVAKRTKEIYLIDYDGWKDSITQATFFNTITIFPDWAPDGNQLAYVSFKDSQAADCFIQNLPTGKVSILARFKGTNNTPRWYPDGHELAISISAEGNPEIYRITPGNKNPKRLTFNPGIDEGPDVSPTGNQIAFISDRDGQPQVYLMEADGSNPHRISYIERKADTPIWSPIQIQYSGEAQKDYRIAFTGFYSSLQSDIYTVKPDGTGAQMLTDQKGDNQNPSWAPNGKYIAFSSNRTGKHEIYIMPSEPGKSLPNGERFFRVTYLGGENLSPAWSPN